MNISILYKVQIITLKLYLNNTITKTKLQGHFESAHSVKAKALNHNFIIKKALQMHTEI